ncbi:Uncharacterised protein [Vibrio cholerae]|nr:Uncharacterised protein [Vibrio cholerae]CSD31165.1 Uncharacterised protein [Vibrio cholerae]
MSYVVVLLRQTVAQNPSAMQNPREFWGVIVAKSEYSCQPSERGI